MEINSPEMKNIVNEALNKIKDDILGKYFSEQTVEDAYKGDLYAMSMISDLLLYVGKCEEAYVWREAIKERL